MAAVHRSAAVYKKFDAKDLNLELQDFGASLKRFGKGE
jgi:hypothetical protein